jgi:transcriptional regulator with XRE-family HTH domain
MLVWTLAARHHDGNLLAMARKTRIPQSSLWRWCHGLGSPRADLLAKLSRTYSLDPEAVWMLVARDAMRRATRKRVPLPDLSDVRPGPNPSSARLQKR